MARDQNVFNDDAKDDLTLEYFLASLSVVLFCVNQGAVRYNYRNLAESTGTYPRFLSVAP